MGKPVIEKYQITSKVLPKEFDGVKIAYLSDLHSVSFGEGNKQLLELLQKAQPDYVFLGGDLIVGRREFPSEVALMLCQELAKAYPVYMGMGNHEQKLMCYEETKDTLFPVYIEKIKQMGIKVLDNEAVQIKRGAGAIRLYGLTMDYKYYGKIWDSVTMEAAYISELLGSCRKEEFSVLLAHIPKYFEAYSAWGADLVLSGHVHGGIMRLPWIGGVIAPDYRLFPKYDAGHFTLGDSQMVLSRGLGAHTIKLRVFNPPEVSVIVLKKELA